MPDNPKADPTKPLLAFLIADSALGGGPRHVLDILTNLHASQPGWQLALICPDGWLAEEARKLVPVTTFRMMGNALSKDARTSLVEALNTVFSASSEQSLLHVHGVRAGIMYQGTESQLSERPRAWIYTEHRWTADYHLTNPLREFLQLKALKKVMHTANQTVAVSHAVADFLLAKKLVRNEQLTIIPNGIEIPSDTEAEHVYIHKPPYIIGGIGNLLPVKGFDVAIRAMPLILQNIPHVSLEIVGEGPERSSLERLIRALKLQKNITLLGRIPDPKVHLHTWDIALSTSQTESFGLANAEALAMGVPVVASESPASAELITVDVGRLVPRGDEHAFAKAVIDLLPQGSLREKLGQNGRKRIKDYYSKELMLERLSTLYKRFLAKTEAK